MVVASNDWRVDVDGVRDRVAEAVTGENHFDEVGRVVGYVVIAIDKYCEANRIMMGDAKSYNKQDFVPAERSRTSFSLYSLLSSYPVLSKSRY